MGQQLFRPAPPRGRPYLAVEGHGTTYNAGPTKDVGRPEPVLFNRGEGAFSPPPPPRAKPQPTSEQRYVPKSFTNNLCPSTSSWTPKIFSEQLASYFGRPLGVGDYYGLQNRVSLYASPDSLASHFRVNSPTGGCSSRERQNGLARSHPPSLLQHRRGVSSAVYF